ncbi:hypothetical protein F4679DRAFT_552452 [Xylaria curta]|nr:hypothetical protein F4679DRAFT_552452 [Xylaria curta]
MIKTMLALMGLGRMARMAPTLKLRAATATLPMFATNVPPQAAKLPWARVVARVPGWFRVALSGASQYFNVDFERSRWVKLDKSIVAGAISGIRMYLETIDDGVSGTMRHRRLWDGHVQSSRSEGEHF